MEVKFNEEEIVDIFNYVKQLPATESNSLYNPITRDYKFRTLRISTDTKWVFDRMYKAFYSLTGIEVKKPVSEIYIHNYTTGSYFLKHTDVPTKIWNIGASLNDDYEGGDFIVYNPYTVLPRERGSIYCFESQKEHEVLPITSGERWSMILFLEQGHIGKNKPTQLM